MLTKENLEARKTGIGGSDVAGILGQSKWATPLSIWQSKFSDEDTKIDNKYIDLGNRLEPVVLDLYKRDTGHVLKTETQTLRSKKYPWMIAHIDAWGWDENENKIVVEAKTTGAYAGGEWGEPYTDDIPIQYLLQVAHYAIVCEIKRVDLAVLLGDKDFRIYTYHSNKELERQIIEATKSFWDDYIVTKTPPLPSSTKEAIEAYNPDSDKIIEATGAIEGQIYSLEKIKEEISELKNKEEAIKTNIANFMADATTIQDASGHQLVTFKETITKRFDTAKFKAAHKDMYDDFINVTKTRRFLTKVWRNKNE